MYGCWEIVISVYVELRIEILSFDDWKNDLNYCDCEFEIVEMDWDDELCELFVFDGNELVS